MIITILIAIYIFYTPILAIDCQFGFSSSGAFEPCIIKGCKSLQQNQLCSRNNCLKGFYYSEPGYCFAEKCTQQYASQCQRCVNGYQLSFMISSNVKVCVPQNCQVFSSQKLQCQQCKTMYEINENKGCVPKNCRNFNQLARCNQCNSGFDLINRVCIPKTCQSFNFTTNKCEKCEDGFIVDSQEICIRQNQLCTNFNQITGLCRACKQGFRLVGLLKCVRQNQLCIQYDFEGCKRCQQGYQVENNTCVPKGCKYANLQNPEQCQECIFGYQLNDMRKCDIKNCRFLDNLRQNCLQCEPRYQIQITTGLCATQNCSLFNRRNPAQCIFCHPQYLLVNGQCHLSNCNLQKGYTCQTCVDGWRKNVNNNCVIRDCLTYIGLLCQTCRNGRRLLRGLCVPDNCLLRKSNGDCLQCQSEYQVPDGFPNLCVPYFCARFDSETGQCQQCYSQFNLNSEGFCTNKQCRKFEDMIGFVHPQCVQCQAGFYPLDRYCVPNRCERYDIRNSICESCQNKYELKIVPGYPSQPKVCIIHNCKLFPLIPQPYCQKCHSGYVYDIQNKQCIPNNCIETQYEQDQSVRCLKCEDKFNMAFGICLAKFCTSYDDQGECQKCKDGFQLFQNKTCGRALCAQQNNGNCMKCIKGYYISIQDGSCIPYNCQKIVYKATSEYNIPVCQVCAQGYYHQQSYCVYKDCASFNQNFTCSSCPKQHQLQQAKCIFSSQLIRYCRQGQYFDTTSFYCKQIKVTNCRYVDQQNPNLCIKCNQNFALINSSCYSFQNCAIKSYYSGCLQCSSGYLLEKGSCNSIIPDCLNYNSNNVCIECKKGFSITTRPTFGCTPIPLSCAFINQFGMCAGCRDPNQIISDNKCIYYSQKCLNYDQIYGQCLECEQGYFYLIPQKRCQILPLGCLNATSDGFCQICSQKFIKNNGKCFNKIENCRSQLRQTCILCDSNYYITNEKKCERIPVNCLKAKPDGTCQQCKQRFYNLQLGECARKIDYCQLYDNKKRGCLKCLEGYSASENKLFCLFGA